MNRHVTLPIACVVILIAGCSKNNEQAQMRQEEPYRPASAAPTLDSLDAAPEQDAALAAYPDEATYAEPTDQLATEPVGASDEVLSPSGNHVHVVRKGDTLYALARQYYSDQARWRDIYEANRARLRNPDQIAIGMKLIIP